MKYRDNMSEAELTAFLAEVKRLDICYGDAYSAHHWGHELADLIYLTIEWEKAAIEFGKHDLRHEWDNEKTRGYFVDDCMIDQMDELRRAALNHRGEP